MLILARLPSMREEREMSQGDVEKSAGLLRCHISRVENGHTMPSLETLGRFAAAPWRGPLHIILHQCGGSSDA